jgi:hypothetical protein
MIYMYKHISLMILDISSLNLDHVYLLGFSC